jgi:serine/threonine protein kinase/WD40 repeat protein
MSAQELNLPDLVDVLRDEQRRHWQDGDRPLVESYFASHPRLLADPSSALQMVYNEVLLREEQGESPALDEYQRRFPQLAGQLTPLFEVHRALESDQLLVALADKPAAGATLPTSAVGAPRAKPTVVGYEILEELGRGGMGVVYKARQLGLNRLVALKMILAGSHADPAQLTRFCTEAKAVARLQHPNIVQIYDVGEQEGRPYFSMEFVDGPSLALEAGGTPQPAREAADLIQTLARAMHTAHQKGIIHRDLKPANILFQKVASSQHSVASRADDGSLPTDYRLLTTGYFPKITDFGLAKQLDGRLGQTASGMIVGTPSYMAPEQANGRSGPVGAAVDVYALGAILYELLTGRPPFKAATQLDTLRQVVSDEPVPVSRFHLKVPRDLTTICMKCLQKEPNRRYQSALALAEDLERFLANQPILARRTPGWERAWRWCQRNPAVALLAAWVAFLLLLLAGGASVAALRLSKELARAEKAEQAAQQDKETATEQLRIASFAQAQALRRSGFIGQRFDSLKAIQEAGRISRARGATETEILTLRSEAIACLALTDLRIRDEWEIPNWRPFASFDAALETYACPDEDGNIHVGRTIDHHEFARLPGPGKHADSIRTDFSPDGRFLLAHYDFEKGNLNLVWQLSAQNNSRRVLNVADGWPQFTPVSGSLAVALKDGTLNFYDLATGEPRKLCADFRANQMAFRPDGKQLAHADNRRPEVRILDTATGDIVKRFSNPEQNIALAWSHDGRLLAAASNNARICIWDAATGRQHAVLEGSGGQAVALRFHPSGQLLASTTWETTQLWDARSGKALVNGQGRLLNFSPNGRRAGFQQATHMGIWEVAHGRECRLLEPQTERTADWMNYAGPECIDYSPDGRLLASVGGDGVRLWDTATAKELAHLPIGYHEATLFHPSGCRLFTYGRTGLKSWTMTKAPGKPGIQIGDPQAFRLPPNTGWFRLSCSQDGRVLAVTNDRHWQIVLLKVEAPSETVVLGGNRDVVSLAVSGDGKWVAAGMVKGKVGVGIWDAQSGGLVRRIPVERDGTGQFQVAFSPNGRWLLTGGPRECRFWEVGSWEPGPVIARDDSRIFDWPDGPIAFSKDGRVLALARSQEEVQLFDLVNQREVATLIAPDPHTLSRLCFNHDGTQLAASTEDHLIHVWDLRAIRHQLREMNLDWE